MTDIHILLPVISIVLAVVGMIKKDWPLLPVAVLILGVNALVK